MVTALRNLISLSLSLMILYFCCGCGDSDPGSTHQDDDAPRTLNTSNEDFVLSEQGEAMYTDVIAGLDDEVHVLYTDGQDANTVYYRYSANRGKTWSPNVNLMEGSDPATISTIRIIRDGTGLIYAIWKTLIGSPDKANEPEGLGRGALTCRVLQGNLWSKPFTIGPSSPYYLFSWFACTDSRGQVHVIWNQSLPSNPEKAESFSGTFMQADLHGTTVSTPKVLLQAPASGEMNRFASVRYYGLNGYIAPNGAAHWIAERQQNCAPGAGGCQSGQDVVYWNGTKEIEVTHLTDVAKMSPRLLVDTHGNDHVIEMGADKSGAPGLLDIQPGSQEDPIAIMKTTDTQGGLRGFQVIQSPKGEMAILAVAEGVSQGRLSFQHNLYSATFDGTNWSKPTNVTDSATRLLSNEGNTSNTDAMTILSVHSASGAFLPNGSALYLLLIAEETGVNPKDHTRSEVHITTGSGTGGNVLFRNFPLK